MQRWNWKCATLAFLFVAIMPFAGAQTSKSALEMYRKELKSIINETEVFKKFSAGCLESLTEAEQRNSAYIILAPFDAKIIDVWFKAVVTKGMIDVSRGEYRGGDVIIDLQIHLLQLQGKTPSQFAEEMLPDIKSRVAALGAEQEMLSSGLCREPVPQRPRSSSPKGGLIFYLVTQVSGSNIV